MIYTRSMVYIFSKGKQQAVYTRNFELGGYSSDKDHLCSQHRHYRDRSPAYYLQQSQKRSEVLHRLIGLIFSQNRYPEQLYKTCDGLFALHRMADKNAFQKACQMAIEHQNYSYRFIKTILENKMTQLEADPSEDKPLPSHRNLRGKQHYKQLTLKYNNNESD